MCIRDRFKDDAKEVASGYECGIGLERFNDTVSYTHLLARYAAMVTSGNRGAVLEAVKS